MAATTPGAVIDACTLTTLMRAASICRIGASFLSWTNELIGTYMSFGISAASGQMLSSSLSLRRVSATFSFSTRAIADGG